ncbi:MAG TPA: hypothetical protein VGN26_24320 [Armatimonadota bacterium]
MKPKMYQMVDCSLCGACVASGLAETEVDWLGARHWCRPCWQEHLRIRQSELTPLTRAGSSPSASRDCA